MGLVWAPPAVGVSVNYRKGEKDAVSQQRQSNAYDVKGTCCEPSWGLKD